MRTFGLHHFTIALALTGSLAAAPLAAQQSAYPQSAYPQSAYPQSADPAPAARVIPARCTDAGCGGDFELAIVTALYPYYDGSVRGPGVLTLVIENRGRAPAPLATLEVTPVTHYASYAAARRAPVGALMPGERTVVEIPLQLDANGAAPCISIALSPSIVPTPAQTQVFASATPAVEPSFGSPPFVSFIGEDGF